MPEITIDYEQSEKQALFHSSDATETFFGGAKGGGKAQDLETLVATPTGWTTIRDILPGDKLFSEDGKIIKVLAATPVMYGHECYKLTFDDGTEVVADAGHLWKTFTAADLQALVKRTDKYRDKRRATRPSRSKGIRPDVVKKNSENPTPIKGAVTGGIRTTEEIFNTFKSKAGYCNHAVMNTEAINLPERKLPIDPYVLGAWLGDGDSCGGGFTTADTEMLSFFKEAGFTYHKTAAKYRYRIDRLTTILRQAGLKDNKHIPMEYLRASKEQRLFLLQGLMDTDGFARAHGGVEFVTVIKSLANEVQELVVSLGWKVSISEGVAKLYGRPTGPKFRLVFTPDKYVFKLSRKREAQGLARSAVCRAKHRFIISCEAVPSVPVRCIEVSGNGMYLCSRSMIPTHNSTGLVMDCLGYCLEFPGAEAYLFRETYDDLEANLISEWKKRVPKNLYKYNESKHEASLVNGSLVKFRYVSNYADAEHYQGRSMDYIGIDELTRHLEKVVQELLSCLRSAKGFPPTFKATGNPGGIGHRFVKKRYVIPTDYGKKEYTDIITGNKITFIPSKVYDNPAIMANDPAYVRRLENLPEAKKRAFLHGDWDVYTGQGFPEWNESIHICDNFDPPPHWKRWRCLDNGYADPFYWGWMTVSPEGTVYLYREFTRDRDDPRLLYTEQAEKAVELSKYMIFHGGKAVEVSEKFSYTVAGVDAWNKHHRDQSGKTLVDLYMEGGISGLTKAVTDRKMRKDIFHEYLKPLPIIDAKTGKETGKYTAKFQVMRRCKNFIENFPELVEDEDNSETIADCDYDAHYDAAGYGIISHHAKRSKDPKEEITGPGKKTHDHIKRLAQKDKGTKRYR